MWVTLWWAKCKFLFAPGNVTYGFMNRNVTYRRFIMKCQLPTDVPEMSVSGYWPEMSVNANLQTMQIRCFWNGSKGWSLKLRYRGKAYHKENVLHTHNPAILACLVVSITWRNMLNFSTTQRENYNEVEKNRVHFSCAVYVPSIGVI